MLILPGAQAAEQRLDVEAVARAASVESYGQGNIMSISLQN
jgi:hypothetical protein